MRAVVVRRDRQVMTSHFSYLAAQAHIDELVRQADEYRRHHGAVDLPRRPHRGRWLAWLPSLLPAGRPMAARPANPPRPRPRAPETPAVPPPASATVEPSTAER